MSDYSNVYFDKILIYAEVNYFDDICKENDANKFIRELSKFFKVFGWKSKFINARGKVQSSAKMYVNEIRCAVPCRISPARPSASAQFELYPIFSCILPVQRDFRHSQHVQKT